MIEVLTDEEVKQLLAAINPNCCLGARLYAMVLLLLDTGIRATELTTLTLENTHLHLADSHIAVQHAGSVSLSVEIVCDIGPALLGVAHDRVRALGPQLAVKHARLAINRPCYPGSAPAVASNAAR